MQIERTGREFLLFAAAVLIAGLIAVAFGFGEMP